MSSEWEEYKLTEQSTIDPAKEEVQRLLAKQYAVLAEIGRIITSSVDREEVYERFVEQVQRLIPPHEMAFNIVDPSLTGKLVRELAELRRVHRESLLTPRQVEILKLVAHGGRYKEIASWLFFSERTVQREIRKIFDQLGVNDAAHAVSEAYKRRLI